MQKVKPLGAVRAQAARRAMMQMKDLLLEVRAELDEQLRPLQVTSAQMKVLREVEVEGRLTGAKAARLCHVTPQTLQAQMVRLEKTGLVRRSADPENERLVLWSLSAAGARLMRRAETIFDEVQRTLWEGTTAPELAQLNELLESCLRQVRARREA